MIKHIGRHGDKKVAILFRTVPNENSMCLVIYSDLLPRTYHDAIMRVLESDVGQAAFELSDALFRNLLPDGRNILEVLHKEGLIKKVPTSQVIVTPDAKSSCRLDELNKIMEELGVKNENASAVNMATNAGTINESTEVKKTPEQLLAEIRAAMAEVKRLESQLNEVVSSEENTEK